VGTRRPFLLLAENSEVLCLWVGFADLSWFAIVSLLKKDHGAGGALDISSCSRGAFFCFTFAASFCRAAHQFPRTDAQVRGCARFAVVWGDRCIEVVLIARVYDFGDGVGWLMHRSFCVGRAGLHEAD